MIGKKDLLRIVKLLGIGMECKDGVLVIDSSSISHEFQHIPAFMTYKIIIVQY